MYSLQILHNCPHCKIEGILVEGYQETEEKPSLFACSFCGYEEKMKSGGMLFLSESQTKEHLQVWIKTQGGSDMERFCELNFCGLSASEVVSRLINKQDIPASFDILEHIFPGFAGGGMSITLDVGEELWEEDAPTEEAYTYRPDPNIPIESRALCAVMLADGKIHEKERQLIAQILSDSGCPPPKESDIQSWLPVDLPIPNDPDSLVISMLDVAFCDAELDETEWRVIREFARYWGFDRKRLEQELQKRKGPPRSFFSRLWAAVKTLLFQENP